MPSLITRRLIDYYQEAASRKWCLVIGTYIGGVRIWKRVLKRHILTSNEAQQEQLIKGWSNLIETKKKL